MTNRRRGHAVRTSLLFLIAVALGAYTVLTYWLPMMEWRKIEQLNNTLKRTTFCTEGDTDCIKQNATKQIDNMEELVKAWAPLNEVLSNTEFIKALKHHDNTECFITDKPEIEVTDEQLRSWLNDFGTKRFINMIWLIHRSKKIFEDVHHAPTPKQEMVNAADKIKWKYTPFGTEWRSFNYAARFWNWSKPILSPRIPDSILKELFPNFIKYGPYFTFENLTRMANIAKSELTSELLAELSEAIVQYRKDMGTLPTKSEGKKLNLMLLVSSDSLPADKKNNWNGPYLSYQKTKLPNDWWNCPIRGITQGDGFILTSLGSECTIGGTGYNQDITYPFTGQTQSE